MQLDVDLEHIDVEINRVSFVRNRQSIESPELIYRWLKSSFFMYTEALIITSYQTQVYVLFVNRPGVVRDTVAFLKRRKIYRPLSVLSAAIKYMSKYGVTVHRYYAPDFKISDIQVNFHSEYKY